MGKPHVGSQKGLFLVNSPYRTLRLHTAPVEMPARAMVPALVLGSSSVAPY